MGQLFTSIQKDGRDKGAHQSYLGTEKNTILLTFQTGFNFVSAAVVCAILESISGLEPSSVKTEPRHLELVTIYFNLCVDATGVVCHQRGLLGTNLHAVGCGGFVETLN